MTRHSFYDSTPGGQPQYTGRKAVRYELCVKQEWKCHDCGKEVKWVECGKGETLPDNAAVTARSFSRLHPERSVTPGENVVVCWACSKARSSMLLASLSKDEMRERAQGPKDAWNRRKPIPMSREIHDDELSLRVHKAVVKMISKDPNIVNHALKLVERWRNPMNKKLMAVLDVWDEVLTNKDWGKLLGNSDEGRLLRRHHSPLAVMLPRAEFERIADEVFGV